jgi:hypothetical protein
MDLTTDRINISEREQNNSTENGFNGAMIFERFPVIMLTNTLNNQFLNNNHGTFHQRNLLSDRFSTHPETSNEIMIRVNYNIDTERVDPVNRISSFVESLITNLDNLTRDQNDSNNLAVSQGIDPLLCCTKTIINANEDCYICLDTLLKGSCMYRINTCSHFFCVDCLGTWLKHHRTCPTCKADLEPIVRNR